MIGAKVMLYDAEAVIAAVKDVRNKYSKGVIDYNFAQRIKAQLSE